MRGSPANVQDISALMYIVFTGWWMEIAYGRPKNTSLRSFIQSTPRTVKAEPRPEATKGPHTRQTARVLINTMSLSKTNFFQTGLGIYHSSPHYRKRSRATRSPGNHMLMPAAGHHFQRTPDNRGFVLSQDSSASKDVKHRCSQASLQDSLQAFGLRECCWYTQIVLAILLQMYPGKPH